MKYIRYLSFAASAAALIVLTLCTIHGLVEFSGDALNVVDLVIDQPSLIFDSYYTSFSSMGLNYHWFGQNGPLVVLAALITTLIVSKP